MHARDRGLDARDAAYWVCAYANNQWQIGTAVTADPRDSAFFQAMSKAQGVVSVVDSSGFTFKRIWCCYEVTNALEWAETKGWNPPTLSRGSPCSDALW